MDMRRVHPWVSRQLLVQDRRLGFDRFQHVRHGGQGIIVTRIHCAAASAVSRSTAATAASTAPRCRTFSRANRVWSANSLPKRYSGVFQAVNTALTPGRRSASLVSTESTRACACSLKRNFPCSRPGGGNLQRTSRSRALFRGYQCVAQMSQRLAPSRSLLPSALYALLPATPSRLAGWWRAPH